MKKILKMVVPVLLAVLVNVKALPAQNSRWDYVATTTSGSGQAVPLLAIPGAQVTFYSCTAGNCTTLANTYNSASSVTPCPTSAQVVPALGASCVSTADFQGNFGAWFQPGQYAYALVILGQRYGPYPFTIGGGSGGSGTVGDGSAGQIAHYGADGNMVGGVTMSGDATFGLDGSLTLTTVNSSPGSCGDSTHVGQVTVNGKGLTTSCTPVAINFPAGGPTLQTNGVNNSSQSTLNLQNGTGISISNPSDGNVFISATGAANPAVGSLGTLQMSNGSGQNAAATPNYVNAALGISNGLDILGDSIAQATGATSTGPSNVAFQNGYSYLVQQTVGGPFLLGGTSGDQVADVNYKWIYRATNPQGVGIDPVYVHELGTNDAVYYLGDSNKQAIFQRLVMGSLAWLSVPRSNKMFAQNCTLAGGMAADANTILAGLGAVATTNGATASCAISTPKASDTIYACYLIQDGNTGTFTLSLDGVAQTDPFNGTTTWDAFGDGGAAIQTHNSVKDGIACARFTGFSAGTHTVLFTVTSATGSTAAVWPQWVGAAPASSTQNPYVIAVSPNQQNTSSAGAPYAATYAGFINTIVGNLAADGLNVSYSDTSNALLNSPSCGNGNQAQMFTNCYADAIHPNNTGHSVMASTIEASTPASALLAVSHWNPKQPGQNYLPAQPLSPYQFFDVNPYNLIGASGGWVPGIKFQGGNGQVFYEAYNFNTGLTIGGPVGALMFSICPYGGSGFFAAAPPTLASCYFTMAGNGLASYFGTTLQIQSRLMQTDQNTTFLMPGILKVTNQTTGNTGSGTWSTQTATASQNYNSGCWNFNAAVWDAVLAVPGYEGPCLQGVPVTPTPAGSKGQVYLTLQQPISNYTVGLDLRNASLTNHLGTADVVSLGGTGSATFALGAASGVGSGAAVSCLPSHVCDSLSGAISLTTGTGITGPAAPAVTVNLGLTRTNQPNCTVTMQQSTTVAPIIDISQTDTVHFAVSTNQLVDSTTYQIYYVCGGN